MIYIVADFDLYDIVHLISTKKPRTTDYYCKQMMRVLFIEQNLYTVWGGCGSPIQKPL